MFLIEQALFSTNTDTQSVAITKEPVDSFDIMQFASPKIYL